MKKLSNILVVAMFFACGGCMDLTETPQSSLSPETFYSSPAQVEAAFAASMDHVWCQWCNNYSYGWQFFADDDQIVAGSRGDLNIGTDHAWELWEAHYKALLDVNTALKAVMDGHVQDADEETLDLLVGEAKFLRAWNYFQLVRLWGGVPVYLEQDNPVAEPKARASIAEVYAQIVSDFSDAAEKLPVSWDGAPGKPTRGAANGLLAKVYLTMATAPLNETSNYAKAAETAKKVIDAGTYSLVPNIGDVFKIENKYGPEMMWGFNSTMDVLATDAPIWGPSEDPYYGWGDYMVDTRWDSLYPQQPRKDAYIIDSLNGVYYTSFDNPRPSVKKYMPPYITEEQYQNYTSPNNLPIIRFADVLLIFAEADNMANGGPTQEAVDAVNLIIDRANGHVANPNEPLLTTAMTKEDFDKAVINERSLELCFEYDRYFDLLRKRMLKDVTPWAPQNFSDDDYLWPIPQVDLKLNPLLTQNPGYAVPPGSK
ncbi:MAG TPA: RagB/SusD family nutrient uptake outer membrane protein [Chryseosolibacter sp.]|nr:RagB/SusD family nutrient uptake outer membrane protein [Chryseosolibacter sp.]